MNIKTVRVVADPKVMMGKPVIAGTRITLELILEKLGAGETVDQIVAAHPGLTEEDVRAALDYAARVLRMDSTTSASKSWPFVPAPSPPPNSIQGEHGRLGERLRSAHARHGKARRGCRK